MLKSTCSPQGNRGREQKPPGHFIDVGFFLSFVPSTTFIGKTPSDGGHTGGHRRQRIFLLKILLK